MITLLLILLEEKGLITEKEATDLNKKLLASTLPSDIVDMRRMVKNVLKK